MSSETASKVAAESPAGTPASIENVDLAEAEKLTSGEVAAPSETVTTGTEAAPTKAPVVDPLNTDAMGAAVLKDTGLDATLSEQDAVEKGAVEDRRIDGLVNAFFGVTREVADLKRLILKQDKPTGNELGFEEPPAGQTPPQPESAPASGGSPEILRQMAELRDDRDWDKVVARAPIVAAQKKLVKEMVFHSPTLGVRRAAEIILAAMKAGSNVTTNSITNRLKGIVAAANSAGASSPGGARPAVALAAKPVEEPKAAAGSPGEFAEMQKVSLEMAKEGGG